MNKKNAYVKKMKAQLDEWSARIDILMAKFEKAEAGLQLEYEDRIEKVKSLRMAANKKISDLKEAGDDTWEELTDGIEAAWNELGNALDTINI